MSNLTQLTAKIEELEKRIKALTNTVSISNCKEILSDIKSIVSDFESDYTEHVQLSTQQHLEYDARLDTIEDDILSLETSASETDYSSLIENLNGLISDFQALTQNSTSTMAGLDSEISDIKGSSNNSLSDIESDLSDLEGRVELLEQNQGSGGSSPALEQNVSTLQTTVNNLQSTVASVSSAQTSISSAQSVMNSRLSSAENSIASLQNQTLTIDGNQFKTFCAFRQNYNKIIPNEYTYLDPIRLRTKQDTPTKVEVILKYVCINSPPSGNLYLTLEQNYSSSVNTTINLASDPNYYVITSTYIMGNYDTFQISLKATASIRLDYVIYNFYGYQPIVQNTNALQNMFYYNQKEYFIYTTAQAVKSIRSYRSGAYQSDETLANYTEPSNILYSFTVLPKLTIDSENGVQSSGFYVIGFGRGKLGLTEYSTDFTVVSSEAYTTNNATSYSCYVRYNSDAEIEIISLDQEGKCYKTKLSNVLNGITSLQQMKYNNNNLYKKFYNICHVKDFELDEGATEIKDYGMFGTCSDGYIYYYDSFNATKEVQIVKGYSCRAYKRSNNVICLYYQDSPEHIVRMDLTYDPVQKTVIPGTIHPYAKYNGYDAVETKTRALVYKYFGMDDLTKYQ